MSIRLSWKNRNTQNVTVKIYRSTTAIDRAALPEPITTLTDGEIEYVDPDAAQGNTYFYVFETIGDTSRVISRNYQLQATETRGPGSNVFKYGDRSLGYYDLMPASVIITAESLIALSGITGAIVVAFTYWHKIARNGKVYFVPNKPIARNVKWTALNTAGVVDGTKTITVGNDVFKVRLPSGWSDDTGAALPDAALNMDTVDNTCEFNDLMYPMGMYVPLKQRVPNWAQQTYAELGFNNYPVVLCREASTVCVGRGASATIGRGGLTALTLPALATTAASNVWWPILELVEV